MGEITLIPPIQSRVVHLDGREVKGRPVQFDQVPITKDMRGADGEFVIPTLYEAQCPFCAYKLQFTNKWNEIQCPHCQRGQNIPIYKPFPNPFCNPGDYDPIQPSSNFKGELALKTKV